MADYLVLVNGLPGAGKSTLAAQLAPLLGVPLIAKDAIKEALAGALPGVPTGTLGPVAAETMWTMAAALTGGALLESWWFRPRDREFALSGLQRSGAGTVVEIWCDVPAEVALARFTQRRRHPMHRDEHHARHSWPRWAADAEPLALGAVVPVRTDHDVDLAELARRVTAELTAVGEADTAECAWTRRPSAATRPPAGHRNAPPWPGHLGHVGAAARPPSPLPDAAGRRRGQTSPPAGCLS